MGTRPHGNVIAVGSRGLQIRWYEVLHGDTESSRKVDQRRKRREDLAQLDRADVSPGEVRGPELGLREPLGGSQLSDSAPEGSSEGTPEGSSRLVAAHCDS